MKYPLSAFAFLGKLLLAAGMSIGAASANERVTLILDWVPNGAYASFYAGIDQGFYAEEGIDLTIERGYGSSDTVTKIASGAAAFGVADIASVMAGRVRADAPVKAVASIYTRPPHAIFTLAESGIESFKDLEGRSVGGAPGSAVRVFLPHVLESNGVDIDKVDLVNVEPATYGPLLISGRVDSITSFLTSMPQFERMAADEGKEMRVLQFAETLQIYGNALIASERTMSRSPELVERFTRATLRAMEFGRDNPDEAAAAMFSMVSGMNAERERPALDVHNFLTFESEVAQRLPVGHFDADQLRETWVAVAAAQGLEVDSADPETFVTRDFLPDE